MPGAKDCTDFTRSLPRSTHHFIHTQALLPNRRTHTSKIHGVVPAHGPACDRQVYSSQTGCKQAEGIDEPSGRGSLEPSAVDKIHAELYSGLHVPRPWLGVTAPDQASSLIFLGSEMAGARQREQSLV